MQFEIFSSFFIRWLSFGCIQHHSNMKVIRILRCKCCKCKDDRSTICLLQLLLLFVFVFKKKMLWFAAVGWSLTWCSCCFCYYHYFFVQKEMKKKKKKKKSNIVSYKFFYLIFPVHSTFCSYRWAILFFIHFTKISIETFLFRVANEIKPMRLQ